MEILFYRGKIMTLSEQVFNSIPFYPVHATIKDISKSIDISEKRITAIMLSMDGSLPIAEYMGKYTRINDKPFEEYRGGAKEVSHD